MNAKGEVVAQHVVLPLHIGAFPACCGAVIAEFRDDIAEGDAFLINHPYYGGSPHAPDMCVLSPVFVDGELFGFCGSIAHKSDIGGPVPGSCSGQAREIFNEGLHCRRRYQRRMPPTTSTASSAPPAARRSSCSATCAVLGSDRFGNAAQHLPPHGKAKIPACFDACSPVERGFFRAHRVEGRAVEAERSSTTI
jgi:N-methylhydantoinase B